MKTKIYYYKVRCLTYLNEELICDYLFDRIYDDIEDAYNFIYFAKKTDKQYNFKCKNCYIVESIKAEVVI